LPIAVIRLTCDGTVDAGDYDLWKKDDPRADGDLDGDIDIDDFDLWANNSSGIIIVSSEAVSGGGSLREAIGDADTNPGIDTIVFAPSVHEIALSSQLEIESDLVIDGPGASRLTISGNDVDRVMNVEGATLSLIDVTITDGNVAGNGGGINSLDSNLTLERVTVSNNFVDEGSGGGIYAENGTLFILESTIDGNTAGDGIDAINADVSILSSTISNNGGGYGGMYFSGDGNTLLIANSTISGNGGFYVGGLRIQN
jgi:predicted outer membrane repeat protein